MANDGDERKSATGRKPLLEWAAASLGLILLLALLGFIGWQAVQAPNGPPAVTVSTGRVSQVLGGYVVNVIARNPTSSTASQVEVEGTLDLKGGEAETSSVTFDYIAGGSERKGGLFFSQDPRRHQLEVRALGYREP